MDTNIAEKLWHRVIILCDKYYPILKVWTFHVPIVSIRHPDDLEVFQYKNNVILCVCVCARVIDKRKI